MNKKKFKTIIRISLITFLCTLIFTVQACSKINTDSPESNSEGTAGAEAQYDGTNDKQPASNTESNISNTAEAGNNTGDIDAIDKDKPAPGVSEVHAGDADIEKDVKKLRSYFTQAVSYFEDGSYLLAEYCLNKIKDSYIIIQDHIYYYLAKSLLMQEKYYQAEEYYLKIINEYPDSIWAEKASLEYCDIFYIKEDYTTAEIEYDKFRTNFPDSPYMPYCLFQLAYCQENNGKKQAAFNNYKEIWLKYPLNEYSDYAFENLKRIADEDPMIEPFIPDTNQLYTRGRIFFDAYQYHDAMDEYNRILREDYSGSLTGELHTKTLFQIGMCYYRLLDYSHARDYLIQAYKKSPSGSVADDSLYFTAMALTNLNAADDAISYYNKLINLFPSSNFSDDALYRIGRIYSQRGDFTNAASYFKRVHTEYPSGDKLADALWELGLIQYRAGDYSSARATFSSYASSYAGTQSGEKGLFWTAKCCQKLGENNTAVELYREIVNLNSYSYYTFAAAEMLRNMNIPVEIKKISNNLNPENPEIAEIIPDVYSILEEEIYSDAADENNSTGNLNTSHINKAIEFLKLGFLNSASLEIEAGKTEIEESPAKIPGIATLYFKSGNYSNSINIIGKNFKKLKSTLDKNHIDYLYYLYYPYGFKEMVQKYGSQYNVDPLFILAVIRQESNFMPDAISYAGAQGLMQIMPSTGEGIARQIGIPDYNVNMLTDPDINIKMGTFYLRQQLDNFNQNKIYCAGAYNGGPGRMSGWVSARENMDIDEFIESITYEQTRDYVKRVMGNYYFYQMLYGN